MKKSIRPWILIAAYDVSSGESSEGYVAFNILQRLKRNYRVILITRKNNRESLIRDVKSMDMLIGIHILGFDLPHWARWWKRGSRFYFPYAYLWQLCWPVALLRAKKLRSKLTLCHVLNFHNDSIPSLAWMLGSPMVWGPLNHNELASWWRRGFWPWKVRQEASVGFLLRQVAWRFDPLLALTKHKASLIFSAGLWVDHRLRIQGDERIIRLSQLGVDASTFHEKATDVKIIDSSARYLLVHAGRLDWIKGLDIAIEALALLPPEFRLLLFGKGPAEQKLRRLVKEKALSNRVDFMPPLSREELSAIYGQASFFLFPSSEAGGLAWIEALSSGLPVIGFNGETLLGCNGAALPGVYLAQQGQDRKSSAHALAETVLRQVKEPQDAQMIRTRILEVFGWEIIAKIISENYRRLSQKDCV